jgi:PIN domain nuclease of toxin-antitoxin system
LRLLLDTHCWLWWLIAPEKLSSIAQEAMKDLDNELWLSVASIWEIGIKYKSGKLNLPQPPDRFIPQQIQADQLSILSITSNHALKAADLPLNHKDPFDRMLIAQVSLEGLSILTNDQAFAAYDVVIFW